MLLRFAKLAIVAITIRAFIGAGLVMNVPSVQADTLGMSMARAVALAVPIYAAFALIMPYASRAVALWLGLGSEAARAVVFSGSTRNSLVVLPLAFAVPEAGALLPAVVVTQTLVELVAMLAYVRWVPRLVPTTNCMKVS